MKSLPDKCAQCGKQIDKLSISMSGKAKGKFCDWACALDYSQEKSKK